MNTFITVPATSLPNGTIVPSFQVGAYVCSQGEDGNAAVTSHGKPWVNIDFEEAKAACTEIGAALITELQWLALAWNASQQDCNWTSGKVGAGDLFQGLRNGTVNDAQAGDYVSSDTSEQRWLTLSNGERICDLNGNVYQWVFDDVQGNEKGIIASDFAKDSPSVVTPPFPTREKGMGDYAAWDWSGHALIRGGCWYSESHAGVFRLDSGWPDHRDDRVGFRCTKPIGL